MADQQTETNWKARALAAESQLDALGLISQCSEAGQDVLAMADWARLAMGTSEFAARGLATVRALSRLEPGERGKIRHSVSLRLAIAVVELQVFEQKLRNNPGFIGKANTGLKAWEEYKKRTENA